MWWLFSTFAMVVASVYGPSIRRSADPSVPEALVKTGFRAASLVLGMANGETG